MSPLPPWATNNPLRSILLSVSSLSTGEDLQTNQVRYEDLFFVTETRRVSVYTGKLPSITPRFNLKTAMIPVGAVHRRTRRMMCRLTGGRGVDMKDKSHNCCTSLSMLICYDASCNPLRHTILHWRGLRHFWHYSFGSRLAVQYDT